MMKGINSPYSAAFTGCSFMMYEMNRMLPLFLDKNSQELVSQEIEKNDVLMLNSIVSRKRYIHELKHRFDAVPKSFWSNYLCMDETAQRLGIFFVLMRTYRLIFDFHLNVALKKWNSIDPHIYYDDVATELSQIASSDDFVDSWSDNTKKKVVSSYLTFLNQAGLYDKKSAELHRSNVCDYDYAYYIRIGEDWFLEACFLQPYEIENIKRMNL